MRFDHKWVWDWVYAVSTTQGLTEKQLGHELGIEPRIVDRSGKRMIEKFGKVMLRRKQWFHYLDDFDGVIKKKKVWRWYSRFSRAEEMREAACRIEPKLRQWKNR